MIALSEQIGKQINGAYLIFYHILSKWPKLKYKHIWKAPECCRVRNVELWSPNFNANLLSGLTIVYFYIIHVEWFNN